MGDRDLSILDPFLVPSQENARLEFFKNFIAVLAFNQTHQRIVVNAAIVPDGTILRIRIGFVCSHQAAQGAVEASDFGATTRETKHLSLELIADISDTIRC